MARTIFYKKVGRRYEEVAEYDSELVSSVPSPGVVLMIKNPGHTIHRYDVNVQLAPLIAASQTGEDAMSAALVKASDTKVRTKTPLTAEQKAAWDAFKATMGNQSYSLYRESAAEIARHGVQALIDRADKMLSNPTVRAAYEEFLAVARLCGETELN